MHKNTLKPRSGLSDPAATRSSCGVGVLVDLTGFRSQQLIEDGLRALVNLDHRGARGAEEKTGDGAGLLLQKPHEFFKSQLPGLGGFDSYGVGQLFLPKDQGKRTALQHLVEEIAQQEGFRIIAWRDVPTDNSDLGKTALASEPLIMQVFIEPLERLEPAGLDARLYVLRRTIEKAAQPRVLGEEEIFYICSMDRRKIVYKGLLTCAQLKTYLPGVIGRTGEIEPGAGPCAFFDQYPRRLGPGSSVPLYRPQRRDQYPARELALDEDAGG